MKGRTLTARRWIGAGEDFPKCPYRPTARFVELEIGDETSGDEGAGAGRSLADELGMRDEGGDDDDDDDDDVMDRGDGDGNEEGDSRRGGDAKHDGGSGTRTTSGERTWSAAEISPPPENDPSTSTSTSAAAAAAASGAASASGAGAASASFSSFACQLCTGEFPSRNQLFKHLRRLEDECGAWCEARGGVDAAAVLIERGALDVPRFAPPVSTRKVKPPKKKKIKTAKDERPARAPRPAVDNELWVGGLPASHATCKGLKQLLWDAIPGWSGIPQPVVRMVVRKGWRDKKSKGWVGYGFAMFRDAAEAAQALTLIEVGRGDNAGWPAGSRVARIGNTSTRV